MKLMILIALLTKQANIVLFLLTSNIFEHILAHIINCKICTPKERGGGRNISIQKWEINYSKIKSILFIITFR